MSHYSLRSISGCLAALPILLTGLPGLAVAVSPAADAPRLSQAQGWNSTLHVARLTQTRQQSASLVLQLEVLNKPRTTYANAVYQIFARTQGGRWQEIHTNRGARLMPGEGGSTLLAPEVISLADLEEELRAELGNDLSLEDVELDCVVKIRYDLPGGGRDLRETISLAQSYTRITTSTSVNIAQLATVSRPTLATDDGPRVSVDPSPNDIVTLSNGFKISLVDVVYRGEISVWRYRVEELAWAQDLSNWVLSLPACARVTDYAPNGELVNPDPNARLYGIKWQPGGGFRTGIFSVTIRGSVTQGTIRVAAKGPDVAYGDITGPICGSGGVMLDGDDDNRNDSRRRDRRRRNCNQGIGNGPEGCDPGNSSPHGGSNDEGGRSPRGRR